MGAISIAFVAAPNFFLQGFVTDSGSAAAETAAVRELAVELMRFVAAYNMFDATLIMLVSVLRGAGDTRFIMRC